LSRRATEVTYARNADGNLVKVRPAVPRRRSGPQWTGPIPRVVRAVAKSVADRYGITVDAMLSGERVAHTVRARHEWWRLVKDTWDLSYPETGRLVGGVDHTTIMTALRKQGEGVVACESVAPTKNRRGREEGCLRTRPSGRST
jgi:Bacterial dnaA protein helix-turn-helix